MDRPLSVLFISTHQDTPGGISVFDRLIQTRLKHCRITHIGVGAQNGEIEGALRKLGRLFVVPFQIARQIRLQKIDVVHFNSMLNAKALIRDSLILLALRLTGFRRVLFYIHGWDKKAAQFMLQNFVVAKIYAWLLNGTAQVMVLTPIFKTQLERMGVAASHITLGRPVYDEGTIKPANMPHTPTLLFMGRFDRRKGMFELIEAFARLKNEFPDLKLVLAGDGPEKENLHRFILEKNLRDCVSLPGYVSGAEKAMLLAECSLFVLPTSYPEGMPIALIEAMAAGKPVVTTRAGGIGHYLSDENGVLLAEPTPGAIHNAVRELLNDDRLRDEMGCRNAELAAQFTASNFAAELESIYRIIGAMP